MKPSRLPLVPLPLWMLEIIGSGVAGTGCRHGVSQDRPPRGVPPTRTHQEARTRCRARHVPCDPRPQVAGKMDPRSVFILGAAGEWHPLALFVSPAATID